MADLAAHCDPRKSKRNASRPLSVLGEVGPDGSFRPTPRSHMGKWRAGVLIAIHLAIAAHIIQWLMSGMSDGVRNTLSPVEPSESMFTLETGRVNAGFVMFVLAIISTLIFGRFFCGWACHVVAVQDLCGWMMKKIGIHPKPFRSRLLVWFPLGLALYMFVWPTFRREVLARWLGADMPAWLGIARPLNGFEKHFIVENFWATFPPWYMAIPFLFMCGFAIVYFMGAKAFCTYGCPYGGFFYPADRLAPGRIRVTDACNQCGHCTAVCTSNVRVSEEVNNFGTVVDPGCMKCLDCISACPNDALYFGFGAPALTTKPRVSTDVLAQTAEKRAKRYDLTLGEEIILALIMLALLSGFRGMHLAPWNLDLTIPLLMAVAMAGVGTFAIHKAWRMVRDLNVRAPFWQLKLSGKVKPAGYLFALFTLIYTLWGVQGIVMSFGQYRGNLIYQQFAKLDTGDIFGPNYTPKPEALALAQRGIGFLKLAGPISDSGVGFYRPPGARQQLIYLQLVANQREDAEREMNLALAHAHGQGEYIKGLIQIWLARGVPVEQAEQRLSDFNAKYPESEPIRRELGNILLGQANQLASAGKVDHAQAKVARAHKLFDDAVALYPGDVSTIDDAAELNIATNRAARALEIVRIGLAQRPKSIHLNARLGETLLAANQPADAMAQAKKAVEMEPSYRTLMLLAAACDATRDEPGVRDALVRAAQLPKLEPTELANLARDCESVGLRNEAQALRDRFAKLSAPAAPVDDRGSMNR
jgi:polyferredoxin/tetratricopeptide (TPR) repeat protein